MSGQDLKAENERLAAELRAAVDALRPNAAYANEIPNTVHDGQLILGLYGVVTAGNFRHQAAIVAAYDAKHPEGK